MWWITSWLPIHETYRTSSPVRGRDIDKVCKNCYKTINDKDGRNDCQAGSHACVVQEDAETIPPVDLINAALPKLGTPKFRFREVVRNCPVGCAMNVMSHYNVDNQ